MYLFGVVKFIVRNTNFGLTDFVVDALKRHRTRCPLPALLIAKVILALLIMTFVRNGGGTRGKQKISDFTLNKRCGEDLRKFIHNSLIAFARV